jgi:hypothetical protein
LFQTPDDLIMPMRFAEAAQKALGVAGVKARLTYYERDTAGEVMPGG